MQLFPHNPIDRLIIWFQLAPTISHVKRKAFIGMMLLGVALLAFDLAFAESLKSDGIVGALNAGMILFLCLMAFLLWRQRQQQELILLCAIAGACLFLVAMMSYNAWCASVAPEPSRILNVMAPSFLWFVVLEIGCFFTFRAATALRVSLTLVAVTTIGILLVLAFDRHLSLADLHDVVTLFIAVVLVVGLVYQLASSLEKSSYTDYLTGLPNRAHGYTVLEHEIDRAARYQTTFAIILFDIDYFKKINDVYGHVTGDVVLRQFADFTRGHIRGADMLTRWGGEEFLLVLPESDLASGRLKADHLRVQIKNRTFGQDIHITSSFGVTAFYPRDTTTSMLERVDGALYRAKANGRNCVIVE